MTKRLTRKAFEKWLSEQPENREFATGIYFDPIGSDTPVCPLACWGGREALRLCEGWVEDFEARVDRAGRMQSPSRITAARALKILRSIPQ